jgi:hypothetical protein
VSDTQGAMVLFVEDDFRFPKSVYSIDIRVHRLSVGGTLMKRWYLKGLHIS